MLSLSKHLKFKSFTILRQARDDTFKDFLDSPDKCLYNLFR